VHKTTNAILMIYTAGIQSMNCCLELLMAC
jgi:hypothetical protein